MDVTTSALLLAWVAIALLAMAMAGLLRQVGDLQHRGHRLTDRVGPALHSPAPPLRAGSVRGKILVFASEHCATCETLLREIENPLRLRTAPEILAVYRHEGGASAARVRSVFGESEAFELYGVTLTPFAVAIDSNGIVVAARLIGSTSDLEDFVEGLVPEVPSMARVTS